MKKINKNLILITTIFVFIFGLSFALPASAYTFTVRYGGTAIPDTNNTNTNTGCVAGDSFSATTGLPCPTISPATNTSNTNTTTNTINTISTPSLNPTPTISQISPISAPATTEIITITITGSKFMRGSMGRVNGEDRTTNYIYEKKNGVTYVSSTVLTMDLTKDDLASAKPLDITVFNPAPGGGTSNTITFNDKTKGSNLAAGAIFGSDSFMPKSFIQWLLLLVLVFLGIVLWRKAYGKDKKYKETPLKHA